MEIIYFSSEVKITLQMGLPAALISLVKVRDFWLLSPSFSLQILINPSSPLDIKIDESLEEHNPLPFECGFY